MLAIVDIQELFLLMNVIIDTLYFYKPTFMPLIYIFVLINIGGIPS